MASWSEDNKTSRWMDQYIPRSFLNLACCIGLKNINIYFFNDWLISFFQFYLLWIYLAVFQCRWMLSTTSTGNWDDSLYCQAQKQWQLPFLFKFLGSLTIRGACKQPSIINPTKILTFSLTNLSYTSLNSQEFRHCSSKLSIITLSFHWRNKWYL